MVTLMLQKKINKCVKNFRVTMEINFITHNPGKVKEVRAVLEPEIKVNHVNLEYDEIRSDTPEEISRKAAEVLANQLGKPVVVDDSGIFITALKEFPGTCSAYVHRRIGLKGLLKLMDGVEDRECYYRIALGYCEPGKKAEIFSGEEKGEIAESIRGSNGFGHDPILIPEGSDKTYAEMDDPHQLKKFRRQALEKLREYLLNN